MEMRIDVRGISLAFAMPLLLNAAACSPTDVEQDDIRVESESDGLSIRNERSSRIYYFAIDRHTAAVTLMLWAPCIDPETCDRVDPRRSRMVPSADVFGWGNSDEVIVYWWHLVPAGGGRYRPDEIRSIIVPL
jgi:hypothetical protein